MCCPSTVNRLFGVGSRQYVLYVWIFFVCMWICTIMQVCAQYPTVYIRNIRRWVPLLVQHTLWNKSNPFLFRAMAGYDYVMRKGFQKKPRNYIFPVTYSKRNIIPSKKQNPINSLEIPQGKTLCYQILEHSSTDTWKQPNWSIRANN